MKLKLRNWDQKIEEVRKNAESLYDEYLDNQKLYNNLLHNITKGELVWNIVNVAGSGTDFQQMVNVRKHQDKIKIVEEKIKVFQDKYLKTEDIQIYMKGLVTADVDLLKKSYRMGNMDAAYIWGLVSLQNGITDNKYSESLEALEKVASSNNIYATDAKMVLAEYYEKHGLTEAENLRLSENELNKSLQYYKDVKKHVPNMSSDIKERIEIIKSVIKCYEDKRRSEGNAKRNNKLSALKEKVVYIVFSLCMAVFIVVFAGLFLVTVKHAIHIRVDEYTDELELVVNVADTVILDKHSIRFSENLSFLRGEFIPNLPIKMDVLNSLDFKVSEQIDSFSARKIKKSYVIENGVSIIPDLGETNQIEYVNMPDTVEIIESGAFSEWGSLYEVNLSKNLIEIGAFAFRNCNKLRNITLPVNLKYIGNEAFIRSGLINIVIPETVSYIGKKAFSECTNLTTVELPINLINIEEETFNASGITSINIPDTVSDIGKGAFRDCKNLIDIELPNQITTISESMFQGCNNLIKVKLPDQLTHIEKSAFQYCYNLTHISLPNTIKEISENAFINTGLKSIILPYGIENIHQNNFNDAEKIYVDERDYNRYKDYFHSSAEIIIK